MPHSIALVRSNRSKSQAKLSYHRGLFHSPAQVIHNNLKFRLGARSCEDDTAPGLQRKMLLLGLAPLLPRGRLTWALRSPATLDGMQPETRYAKSGDVHVAYQVFGSGAVDLVFVPGFISNVEHYWLDPSHARWLKRLARFARVSHSTSAGRGCPIA